METSQKGPINKSENDINQFDGDMAKLCKLLENQKVIIAWQSEDGALQAQIGPFKPQELALAKHFVENSLGNTLNKSLQQN